jgi:dihydroxyacetone kinase-like protein
LSDTLNVNEVKRMFEYVAGAVVDSEAELTVIDKKIGDGDHGTNMALGFREVRKELQSKEFDSVNEVFHCVGMTLLDTMGGASGVLFGTLFISGIVGLTPLKAIDLAALAEIFQKSLTALKKRGKARVGDKTMVDAVEPAVAALLEATAAGQPLAQGLAAGAAGARAGMEYTKQCVARFGRAKSFGQASLGLEDAGAVSVSIIFRAMAQWVQQNHAG